MKQLTEDVGVSAVPIDSTIESERHGAKGVGTDDRVPAPPWSVDPQVNLLGAKAHCSGELPQMTARTDGGADDRTIAGSSSATRLMSYGDSASTSDERGDDFVSKTFVLVHGICHGGWTWRPVAEILRAGGHEVHTPTMPGLGAGDDRSQVHLLDTVDYLVDFIQDRDLTDVILVGHSWGGFLISGASARIPGRIERLIYWSAFVPHTGESLIDLCPPAFGEMFRASANASDDNSVAFPLDVFSSALMQDAPAHTQQMVHSLLERQPFNTMNESLDLDEWVRLRLPATYILSADDIALPAGDFGWAPRFPDRLPDVEVIYTPGSHEAQLTEPDGLAAAFVLAAEGATTHRHHRGVPLKDNEREPAS